MAKRGTRLLDQALCEVAADVPISMPSDEPDVRTLADWGYLWADVGEDGRLRLTAVSRRYKDDWGTSQQRHWNIDPNDMDAIRTAVAEALSFLR